MAVQYFDLNGTTAGFGTLTGAWDTTSAFWTTSSAGTATPAAYTFTDADTAQFGFAGTSATAGTATIAAALGVTVNGIVTANLSGLQTIAGGAGATLTLAGTTPTINVGSAGNLTISAVLAGSTAWSKTGTSTLTLSGTNTNSADITVSAGTLSATTTTTALGTNTARNFSVTSGAVLSMGFAGQNYSNVPLTISGTGLSNAGALIIANTGTTTFSSITLSSSALIRATSAGTLAAGASGIITSAGKDLTLAGSAVLTVSGAIVGGGALKVGISGSTSTVILSGANTYSGDTSLDFGSLNVSGSLGTAGTYAGAISIASGTSFGYNSATATTLSGLISGAGSFTKNNGATTATTITNTNTFSGLATIQNGIVSVAVIADGGVNQPLGTNATLAFGSLTAGGNLTYTGSGHSTNKTVNLAGTTGGATITASGTGALVFTSALTATGVGAKTLTLQGTYAGANELQGAIVDSSSGATSLTKAGVGYWKVSGSNTFTGAVTVSGGRLEIPSLAALGSGTKTITVNGGSARNSSLLLPTALTYPSTLLWSPSGSSGNNQTNNPLGAIRALADTILQGAVSVTSTSTVYADTGDLTFSGLITGSTTFFQARAAAGRTVTIAGGFGNAGSTLSIVGPGTLVWNGIAANATTTNPVINGGTIRQVAADYSGQFAHTGVTFAATAAQTNAISSRYQYTGGTLELSNSGASGAVSYLGLSSTSAISLSRGSGTLRLLRDAAQDFSVTLGNTGTINNGVLTVEYGGSQGAGTLGTNSSIIFTGLTASRVPSRMIISDGSAMVPVWLNASKVAIPAVYDGSQATVLASQNGGTTLTSTALTSNHNVTGDITAQASATTNTIRLDTGTLALAAGALLQSTLIMDAGTGTARTIISGASGAKLARQTVGSTNTVLGVWTQNVTGTGATISADMDGRYATTFMKAGSGILTFSGKVENLTAAQLADGLTRIASTGTYNNPFAGIALANPTSGTNGIEFNQSTDVVFSHVNGGGANAPITLNGGNLVLAYGTSTTAVFGGDIVLGGSQKLKIRSISATPETTLQSFQGAVPFTTVEMSRGYISLDPQYGATVTGTPSVTATGGSVVAIQAQNPLEADYTVNFGALTASAGALQVRLANSTTGGSNANPYATRVTATGLTVTGDSVALLLNQTSNKVQSFTVTGASAGPMGNGVNVYGVTANIAFYRLAGSTLSGGDVTPVDTVDVPAYSTDSAFNFSPNKTGGTSFTSAGNSDNINVTAPYSAQTSVTMKSVRLVGASITMASSSDIMKTDLILFATGTPSISSGQVSTQTGNLYVHNVVAGTIGSQLVNNGATLTKLVLLPAAALTLSNGGNDYSGGTVIQGGAGAITLGTSGVLGTGPITANGGQGFALTTGTFTFGSGNTITLNDGGLRLDASSGATYALNSVISGSGDLYLTGAGNHTFGAVGTANTGALRLNSTGTVTLNATQAFSEWDFNSSSLTFQYGTGITQDISAGITKRPNTTFRIDTNGNDVTWASSVGNGSTYVKLGGGTHTLGAENFFATITIGNANGSAAVGTVACTATNALGYGTVTLTTGDAGSTSQGAAVTLSGNITLPNAFTTAGLGLNGAGAIRSTSGSNTLSGAVTLASTAGSATRFAADSGATLTLTTITSSTSLKTAQLYGAGTTIVTGVISGGANLALSRPAGSGAGTTRLQAANTYSGGSTISEGTVLAENVTALGTGAVTLGASGTIQGATAGGQNGKLTIGGNFTNTAGGTIKIGG